MARWICKRCVLGKPHVFKHGTMAGYEAHMCRCAECRRWNSEKHRKRNESLRGNHFPPKRRSYAESHGGEKHSKEYASKYRQGYVPYVERYRKIDASAKAKGRFSEREDLIIANSNVYEAMVILSRKESSIIYRRKILRQKGIMK